MHVVRLLIASCVLVTVDAGMASAQFVEPFKVLEEARRDRLALEKRLAREAAELRAKARTNQATKLESQRKLEGQKSAAVRALSPAGSNEQPQISSTPQLVSDELERTPTVSNVESVIAESTQSPLLQSQGDQAKAALSLILPENTIDKTPGPGSIAAATVPATAPGLPLPAASAPGAAHDTPAPTEPPPAVAPVRDPAVPLVEAPARILITVDKATQRMRVTVDGNLRHSWSVSTARAPYKTPAGTFRPLRLVKEHYSREWDDAPMPHSIFFTTAGHAIHGSTATRRLGRPASHGCIRLAPSNAAALFKLVRAEGPGATRVSITNGTLTGKTARGRTAGAPSRERAHHARRVPSDIRQTWSEDGWTE